MKGTTQDFNEMCSFRDQILESYGEDTWTAQQVVDNGITIRNADAEQLDKKLQNLDGCIFGEYNFSGKHIYNDIRRYKFEKIRVEHNEGFPRIRKTTEESAKDGSDSPEKKLLRTIMGPTDEVKKQVGSQLMNMANFSDFSLRFMPELNDYEEWYVVKVVVDYDGFDEKVRIPVYGMGDSIEKAMTDVEKAYELAWELCKDQTP